MLLQGLEDREDVTQCCLMVSSVEDGHQESMRLEAGRLVPRPLQPSREGMGLD